MHRQTLSLVSIGIIVVILLGYGLFEAHKILIGPQVRIDVPKDGSATSSPIVTISGVARNIAFLSINGMPAYITPNGNFIEMLSLPPGYSVITVAAKDRFGRQVSRVTHITVLNYCPLNT